MDYKSPFPTVDHGVDVLGDEWDELVGREEHVGITMIKKFNPKHPYCTNWPVHTIREKDEKI